MTNIEQVIQKAIEGGYTRGVANIYETLLYPDFWQSLGYRSEEECWNKSCWKCVWHRFIDHLAEGKSIESFFETL